MKRNFPRSLSLVLKHEGGFANHPSDPGGATNKGITIGTYRRYVNRHGTVNDLRNITDEQVAKVYKRHYWDKVRGDDLPSGVDYAAFDFAVNSGPSRSAKYLQRVLGVKQDGIVGPKTIAAAHMADAVRVIKELCGDRMAFLKRLSTWDTFGRGWTSRVTDVRAHSLEMAESADEVDAPVAIPTPKPTGKAVAVGGLIAAIATAIAAGWERISTFFQGVFG